MRGSYHRCRGGAVVVVGMLVACLLACTPPGKYRSGADVAPRKPGQPVSLTILDGSGDLAGSKVIFENFQKAHPELVKSISYQTAGAPDIVGKLRAQALANKVSTSLVLGGVDVLGSMKQENISIPLLPADAKYLPNLNALFDRPRRELQALAQGTAVINSYTPSGPLLEYDSKALPDPPRTPAALLAWAKAHKGKFTYAQPNNSGPGRTFLMSLPYMLGDKNPQDPGNGWDKTWAYLKELGRYVSSYPSSSSIMNKQLSDGTVSVVPIQASFDVGQHSTGSFSADIKPTLFEDQQWVSDGHFMIVPRGVSAETLYVVLQFMKFILTPQQQRFNFLQGGLTMALPDVSVDTASAKGKAVLEKFGRLDFYPKAFKTGPIHAPLRPDILQKAFDKWQREVGSHVGT